MKAYLWLMVSIENKTNQIIDYAVKRHWKVFPVHYVIRGNCSCGKKNCDDVGKHPISSLAPNGVKNATDNPVVIEKWIAAREGMNVGLATGKQSMVVVLDVDEKPEISGSESLKGLEAINGKLPPTLTQTTGGRGKHYFFKYPENVKKIPGSIGKIAPGLDVRADGNYVVIPPSNHKSGNCYEWNNEETPIADIPPWLLEQMLTKTTKVNIDDIRKKAMEIPEGRRNDALFYIACNHRGRGCDEEEIFEKLMVHNQEHCHPPLEETEIRTITNSACRRYISEGNKIIERLDGGRSIEIDYYDFDMTDKGNAFRFYIFNDYDTRYCYAKKRWFVYDGKRWEEVSGGEADLRAYRLLRIMKQEAEDIENDEVKKRYHQFIRQTSNDKGIVNLLRRAFPLMEIRIESMNQDPYDINCLNGTFNLKTMELRKHVPEDHITFLAQVEYDPDAKCPMWEDHLMKVFDGDKKTIESFQRICGYSLTETNPEQVIFIIWGGGKNGKSTTFDIISSILGDYSAAAKAESFMKIGDGNDARNDLARLHRKRLVVTSEPQRNSKLNESLIKSATGGDKISTRFLYQEFFEWIPQFKIFINTNHQPKISDGDEGIWRRIRMIPFTHQFSEKERDRNIKDKLIEEKAGIFNWMIKGYQKYVDVDFGGFKESPAILEATSAYRRREDIFQEYIDERCIVGSEMKVVKGDLYADYLKWCDLSNDVPETQQKFGNMIHGHLATKVKDIRINYSRGWSGIGLKNPTEDTTIDKLRTKAKQARLK